MPRFVPGSVNSFLKGLQSRGLLILGVAVPALLLVLVGWLQWNSVRDYREAREWSQHARTMMFQLETLLACVNDAETGQRGYLLTHREPYLAPYAHAVHERQADLQALRDLAAGNPDESQKVSQLQPLMDGKFAELAQTVDLEKAGAHEDAMAIVRNDSGEKLMEQIRAILVSMHENERKQLLEHEADFEASATRNSILSFVLIVFGFGFVLGIYYLVRRLGRMQEMIKVCAWSKLIEHEGQWLTIEEYLSRRLNAQVTHGLSDVEAEKMLKVIQEEIPDDSGGSGSRR